ncbi:MAG: site-specific integrase [Gemmatimonadota bacterium]
MARKKERVYTRDRGGETRYYADFRDYAHVGGGREALKAPGLTRATADPDNAAILAAARLAELKAKAERVDRGLRPDPEPDEHPGALLASYASYHLQKKVESGKFTTKWLESAERHLRAAVEFFGADRALAEIGVKDVQAWAKRLAELQTRSGRPLSPTSQRKYLNSLSNLFRRAASEHETTKVQPGYNPVGAMVEKPSGVTTTEAQWLEVHEGALLLESARTYQPAPDASAFGFHHELIATFLLTGGRMSEVLGLTAGDVSFERGTVTFRPNDHRRLKTKTSHRPVPLWPQLREILLPYVEAREVGPGALLFPGRKGGMVQELRKALDTIAGRAGWAPGEIRSKMLRHTYCTARLQTLDRGAPVSPFTVTREMGHGGRALVDKVYGHLGQMRHRSEVVEYRVEQWQEELGKRLSALRLVAA